MNEAEWLAAELRVRLANVHGLSRHRKIRLFAIACCRRILNEQSDSLLHDAILRAEQFADGLIRDSTREKWRRKVSTTHLNLMVNPDVPFREYHVLPEYHAFASVCEGDGSPRLLDVWSTMVHHFWKLKPDNAERTFWAQKLAESFFFDIFGNPFRPVTFDPAWRSSTAVGVAETIYADRTFDNLPILADALQDAGCDHPDILSHLRGPGPHVRGCWALDLVLGKE